MFHIDENFCFQFLLDPKSKSALVYMCGDVNYVLIPKFFPMLVSGFWEHPLCPHGAPQCTQAQRFNPIPPLSQARAAHPLHIFCPSHMTEGSAMQVVNMKRQ